MRILLDENLSPLHAALLRSEGHDAVSVPEIGLSGADDSAVRAAAIESGRVLVTLDGDFANVLRFPPAGTPGVIRLRIHPPTEEAVAVVLVSTLSRLAGIELGGKLMVADEGKIRIRG